jgi:hypothetical protein
MPSILYIIVHQSHWLLIAAKKRRLIEVFNVEGIPFATFQFKQGDNLPEESHRATKISCWGTSVVGRKESASSTSLRNISYRATIHLPVTKVDRPAGEDA